MTTIHMGRTFAALALLQAIASCGTGTTVNGDVNRKVDDVAAAPAVPPGSVPLTFTEVPGARTQVSGHNESNRVVLRDVEAWQEYWRRIVAGVTPTPPPPAIDFARHMVLAAAMGQRPSGGYVIGIDSVHVSAGTVWVVVRSVAPGPNCMTAAVMTAPVAAVTVDRTDGPVRFVEKAETRDCG